MRDNDRDWFIGERSDALASLMLTSRPDLSIRSETKENDGVDLLVGVQDGEAVPTKLFVVQVKGTISSDPQEWTEDVKELYQSQSFYIPACVFVINFRDNQAAYAWVAEPEVQVDAVKLSFFERPDFHSLDKAAVDSIVNRVRQWYDAMPRSRA